ncbi:acylphosphatase [Agarivorans sp. DSG3-1]|uniref:acylphosphatase n=1 Tax=Agarivorans sp. DSG3-1 TaxID=3342249 RepID=UPI00398F7587
MELKRVTALAKGKVQGVGYRYHVMLKANELKVCGYAKNLSNGDVEVVAEGSEVALLQLLEHLLIASPYSKVERVISQEITVIDKLSYNDFSSY